jgi:hypothetical protein
MNRTRTEVAGFRPLLSLSSGGRDPGLGRRRERGWEIAVAMGRSGGRDPSAAAFWSRGIVVAMDNKSQQSCRSCCGGLGKNLRVHETYAGKNADMDDFKYDEL